MLDPDDKEAISAMADALSAERQRGRDDRAVECAQLRAELAAACAVIEKEARDVAALRAELAAMTVERDRIMAAAQGYAMQAGADIARLTAKQDELTEFVQFVADCSNDPQIRRKGLKLGAKP